MNCEGSMSITPPSSDNETLEGPSHSPILRRKKKRISKERVQKLNGQSNCTEKAILNTKCKENRETISSKYFEDALLDHKLTQEKINKIYSKVIFQIRELEKQCAVTSSNDNRIAENNNIESNLKLLYDYIKTEDSPINKSLMTMLFECLFNISLESGYLLQTGKNNLHRFYKTRQQFYGDNSSLHVCKNSPLLQIYHLFCEIHSSMLDFVQHQTLNNLKIYYESGFEISEEGDLYAQVSSKIIHILSQLSFERFNQEINIIGGKTDWESLCHKNPYPCSCFNKLLSKCCEKFNNKQEFWNVVIGIVNTIVKNLKTESVDVENRRFKNLEDSLSFCWWWVQSMAAEDLQILPSLITRLIRLSLAHSSDSALTFQLFLYKSIIETENLSWIPSDLAPFNLMWLHFVRNLNTPSTEKTEFGIEKFIVKDQNVAEWLTKCRNLKNIDLKSFSFDLMLCILSIIIKEKDQWNSIHERLLSKIQISLVKNSNETGIFRLFYIGMTILLICPFNKIQTFTKELLTLIQYCVLSKTDYKKQKLMITGYFSLMQICYERKFECPEMEEKIANIFKQVCRLLADKNNSLDRHKEIFKVFVLILQNLIFYFQTSNIEKLSLFPRNILGNILKELKENENAVVLSLFSELVICLRQKKSQNKEFLSRCQDLGLEIFIWLKRQNLNHDQNTLDLICEITVMTRTKLSTFSVLLKYFASSGKISSKTRIEYLMRILSQDEIISVLDNDYSINKEVELCDAVMQGWIQCSMSNNTDSLNGLLKNLKVVKGIFVTMTTKFTLKNLVVTLGERYNLSKNFMERISWAAKGRKWFTVKTVDYAVRQLKSKTIFTSDVCVYSQFALIFKHCSQLLFTEGKPSFISYATDALLINTWNTTDTPPSTLLLPILHQFINGILHAGGSKSNSLKLKLKSIIEIHLTRWPRLSQFEGKMLFHPFIVVLKSEEKKENKNYFMSLLVEQVNEQLSPEKLSIFVEIIHVWVDTKIEVSSFAIFHQCLPILQQARLQLRFNAPMQDKINFLIKNIRSLT